MLQEIRETLFGSWMLKYSYEVSKSPLSKVRRLFYIIPREAVKRCSIKSGGTFKMNFYVNILMTVVVLLFIISGILLKSGKYYWLTPGFGTMREMQSGNVDVRGLRNFLASSCFVIAAILLLAGIFDHYHVLLGFVISIASLFFAVAFMLIRAQKYDRNILPDRKKRVSAKVLLGIIVVILVIIGGTLIYGSIEQSVEVGKDQIEIGGLCGTTIDMRGVSKVSIIDKLPGIQAKRTGFDFANVLKGNFELEGLGDGKLYVNLGTPLFIEIKYDNTFVILNSRDTAATRATYKKIIELQEAD
jgi:preprotein translocase subunit SecG